MSAQARYFKVGLFVIVGTMLLVFGLVVLGSGALFRDRVLLETYINESIQGVDVGTPVKFRGVPIGNVKEIDFVYNVYPEAMAKGHEMRYVYILMEVKPKALGNMGKNSVKSFLEREARKGLRIGLSPQGLTGQFFLELDYYDPERYPMPEVTWAPLHDYIPSVQSTITFFVQSIAAVFAKLEKTNVGGLLDETQATLKSLHRALDEAHVGQLSDQARGALASIKASSDRLEGLLSQPGISDLTSQTRALMLSARRQVEANGGQLQDVGRRLGAASEAIQRVASRLDAYMKGPQGRQDAAELRQAIAALRQAGQSLPQDLARTLAKVDRMLESQQRDMETIMENFQQVSENLRALSEQARNYPSGVIFGGPPAKAGTGAKP
jgi:paraquat-inducible protein B